MCHSSGIVKTKIVPYLITFCLLIEIGIGIHQLIQNHISGSIQSLNLTGSFENSGIFSIYLCVAFPFLYYMVTHYLTIPLRVRLIIVYVISGIIFMIICISMSRTAIIIFSVFAFISIRKKIRKPNKLIVFISKPIAICIVAFFGVAVCLFLLHLKNNSALGRFFIWQVCMHHLPKNVISGIGLGNFSLFYPYWQIDYIATQDLSSNLLLNVDDTHVAFNEYLQLLIEIGILKFLALAWFIVNAFTKNKQNKQNVSKYYQYSFMALLISALFTYSFHVYILEFFFAINISYLSSGKSENREPFSSTYRSIIKSFIFIFLLINLFFAWKKHISISAWNRLKDDYEIKDPDKLSAYKLLYKELQTSGKFLLDFGEQLTINREYKEAIRVMNKSKQLYLSEQSFYLAANASLLSNDTINAIYNAKCLTQLIPFKLSPKAYLANMYLNFGDTAKAIFTLNEIEAMPIKVPSPKANSIKQQAKNLLEQIQEQESTYR